MVRAGGGGFCGDERTRSRAEIGAVEPTAISIARTNMRDRTIGIPHGIDARAALPRGDEPAGALLYGHRARVCRAEATKTG